jgi:hypothetical protein
LDFFNPVACDLDAFPNTQKCGRLPFPYTFCVLGWFCSAYQLASEAGDFEVVFLLFRNVIGSDL